MAQVTADICWCGVKLVSHTAERKKGNIEATSGSTPAYTAQAEEHTSMYIHEQSHFLYTCMSKQ